MVDRGRDPLRHDGRGGALEHRWAIPLRDAIRDAGGVPFADSWIHPEDLVALGASMAEG